MANVILLNGCSSSGKTTLAETLQQRLEAPYQYIGLDQFRDGMPARVRGLNAPEGTEGTRGLNVVPAILDGKAVTEIQFGDYGQTILSGMRQTVASFAQQGIPVIVDDLLFERAFLDEYVRILDSESTWFIAVKCDLDVINQRESRRIGRFPGTATAHYDLVHAHGAHYDLEVDTTSATPRELAECIIARMHSPPEAFRTLRG